MDVLEVVERFAHAHEDNVRHLGDSAFFVHEAVVLQVPVDVDDFFENFACFEVTREAHFCGAAESAVHGAADLGRDANGIATVCRDHHGFNMVTVFGLEKPLYRSIDRNRTLVFLEAAKRELFCHFFAEGRGDVYHLVVRTHLLAE